MMEIDRYLAESRDRTAGLIGELEQMLTQEEALLAALNEQVRQSKARRDRFAKSLAALGAEPAPAKEIEPAKPRRKSDEHTWKPSQRSLDKVLAGIGEHGPISPSQLAPLLHMATETVSKSVAILREREQIRITARIRGGGKLYALMPDSGELAAVADAA